MATRSFTAKPIITVRTLPAPPEPFATISTTDFGATLHLGKIVVHLATGEVTIPNEADLSDAAKKFWEAVRAVEGLVKP